MINYLLFAVIILLLLFYLKKIKDGVRKEQAHEDNINQLTKQQPERSKDFSSWNSPTTCAALMSNKNGLTQLLLPEALLLLMIDFKGSDLARFKNQDGKTIDAALYSMSSSIPDNNMNQISWCVLDWVKQGSNSIILEDFWQINVKKLENFADQIRNIKKNSIESFEMDMDNWKIKQDAEISFQKQVLGSFFKSPLLPGLLMGFNQSRITWTNSFETLRVPETKGKELREYLQSNCRVGRDDYSFSIIPFVDLSNSGKTFSVYNLSCSIPSEKSRFKQFFVIYLNCTSEAIQTLAKLDGNISKSVLLMSLTGLVMIHSLMEHDNSITGQQFLKYFTANGEGVLTSSMVALHNQLSDFKDEDLQPLCIYLTEELSQKFKIKVVFAFDEAQELFQLKKDSIELSTGEKGSLFHAIYKAMVKFNNPVFLGNSLNLSKLNFSVSEESRHFTRPIIGTLTPWFPEHVAKILNHKFNLSRIGERNFTLLCYLLSGSPINVTLFHSCFIEKAKTLSARNRKTLKRLCMQCLDEVLNNRMACSSSKVSDFEILFKLLLGPPQPYHRYVNEPLENSIFSTSMASIVPIGSERVFEIIDPIACKSYFKYIFESRRLLMWEYLATLPNRLPNEALFELVISLLFLEESERLTMLQEGMTSSPLFKKLRNTKFDKFHLNCNSIIKDKTLSTKNLELSNKISGLWYAQMHQFFLDSIIKPDNHIGPDMIFYVKGEENEFITQKMIKDNHLKLLECLKPLALEIWEERNLEKLIFLILTLILRRS